MTSFRDLQPWSPNGSHIAEYPSGASWGPRVMYDFELVWILTGTARWSVTGLDGQGTVFDLTPGMVTLGLPGDHDVSLYGGDGSQTRHGYVHFYLADPLVVPLDHRVREPMAGSLLRALCDELTALAISNETYDSEPVGDLIAVALSMFLRGPVSPSAGWPTPVTQVVQYVIDAWSSTGMRIVSADELAAAANLSKGHVFRLFRDQFGHGPAHALELVRLVAAATALQRSDATISRVAAMTGYQNPYHFSRRFSQTYGQPPGAFRTSTVDPLESLRSPSLRGLASMLLAHPTPIPART